MCNAICYHSSFWGVMEVYYLFCDTGNGTCNCGWLQARSARWKPTSELRTSHGTAPTRVQECCHLHWMLCSDTIPGILRCVPVLSFHEVLLAYLHRVYYVLCIQDEIL